MASGAPIAALLAIATILYPSWLSSYLQNLGERGVAQWQTPTLGGLLLLLWPISWLRYTGLVSIGWVPALDKRLNAASAYDVLSLTLALGVALAPFGWSFDEILLLPMVLQLLHWQRHFKSWWLTVGLGLLYAIPLAMRVAQVDEFLYSWVPWFALGLYAATIKILVRDGRESHKQPIDV